MTASQAFGGNNTKGPIDVATAVNAHGGPHGRLDFESETFIAHSLTAGMAKSASRVPQEQGALIPVQVAHTLRGEGFDASEDGTGRGTPLVPVEVQGVALRGRDGGNTAELTGDLATCLRASTGGSDKAHVLAPLPFDTTQLTHKANRSNPQPGDPCHPLAAGAHPPAIAFSSKDSGQDATVDLAPTLRAGGHHDSHANGGTGPAVAFPWLPEVADPISASEADTYTHEGKNNFRLHNCVPGPVAFNAYQRSAGGDVADTVMADDGRKLEKGVMTPVQSGWAVRRLTPTECERLQGFPDGFTDIAWGKKATSPDGPRYKALGNSMAVPCIAWIMERMQASMNEHRTRRA